MAGLSTATSATWDADSASNSDSAQRRLHLVKPMILALVRRRRDVSFCDERRNGSSAQILFLNDHETRRKSWPDAPGHYLRQGPAGWPGSIIDPATQQQLRYAATSELMADWIPETRNSPASEP